MPRPGSPLDTIRLSNETARKDFERWFRCLPRQRPPRSSIRMPRSRIVAETAILTEPQKGRRSFKLPSTMDSVAEVEAAAEKLIQSAGMDEDESFKVVMAVREAAG